MRMHHAAMRPYDNVTLVLEHRCVPPLAPQCILIIFTQGTVVSQNQAAWCSGSAPMCMPSAVFGRLAFSLPRLISAFDNPCKNDAHL